ncbi:hypothetical protein [Nocardia sp. NPDC051833]|uniref:hypothetical protein n=1 Tax=Nocardia sp. NPDC051833 TaxID=3155674 RepID=UPI003423765C
MAGTLTVWKFPTPTGADTAIATLEDLQKSLISTNLSHQQEVKLREVFAES